MQVQALIDFVRANPKRKIVIEQRGGKVCLGIETARADGFKILDGFQFGEPDQDEYLVEEIPCSLAEVQFAGG